MELEHVPQGLRHKVTSALEAALLGCAFGMGFSAQRVTYAPHLQRQLSLGRVSAEKIVPYSERLEEYNQRRLQSSA